MPRSGVVVGPIPAVGNRIYPGRGAFENATASASGLFLPFGIRLEPPGGLCVATGAGGGFAPQSLGHLLASGAGVSRRSRSSPAGKAGARHDQPAAGPVPPSALPRTAPGAGGFDVVPGSLSKLRLLCRHDGAGLFVPAPWRLRRNPPDGKPPGRRRRG